MEFSVGVGCSAHHEVTVLLGDEVGEVRGANLCIPPGCEAVHANQIAVVFQDEQVTEPPVPALFRDFSAPVKLVVDQSSEDLSFLLANDSDAFNRWEAGQRLV